MAENTTELRLQKFPEKLDQLRYVEFNFYKSDLMKGIVEGLEESVKTTAKTLVNNPTSESVKTAASSIGNTIVSTASSSKNTISDQVKKRINTGKVNSSAINSKTWISSIDLPLPNNLEESLNHEWQEENGPVASILNMGVGPNSLAAQVVNGISALTGTRNVTVNPDYIQMYKGSKPREVTFTWTLMPNNETEAKKIWTIIRRFKAFSSGHPSTSYAFLTAPYFCEIKIRNEKMQEALKFNDMVISNISINYSESGFMEMYWDGTPKAIVLTLSLVERRMKTYNDWITDEEKNTYESDKNVATQRNI